MSGIIDVLGSVGSSSSSNDSNLANGEWTQDLSEGEEEVFGDHFDAAIKSLDADIDVTRALVASATELAQFLSSGDTVAAIQYLLDTTEGSDMMVDGE